MSIAQSLSHAASSFGDLPPLEPGDHLDQSAFHARYQAMPPGIKAELIGGVVYMPSPARLPHGRHTKSVVRWLAEYEEATPGVEAIDTTTAILGDDSEPQPDAMLRILESHGGQSHENEAGWLVGAPELVVEVASSTASYDLHSKLRDYERYGVREYLVLIVHAQQARWFCLENGRLEQPPSEDGILRSRQFPGLWLNAEALFAADAKRLRETLQAGLATPEHRTFVEKLGAS